MEVAEMYYSQQDYIETSSGNKVCRKSVLCGPQNIMILGKVGWRGRVVTDQSVPYSRSCRRAVSSEATWPT